MQDIAHELLHLARRANVDQHGIILRFAQILPSKYQIDLEREFRNVDGRRRFISEFGSGADAFTDQAYAEWVCSGNYSHSNEN